MAFDLVLADGDRGQPSARRGDVRGRVGQRRPCRARRSGSRSTGRRVDRAGVGHLLVLAAALVQGDHAEPRRGAHRHTVALQHHLAGVQGARDRRRGEPRTRSAIASSITPPWASASSPCSATGRPARRVAARSRPPSRRPSETCSGILRRGVLRRQQLAGVGEPLIAHRTGQGAQADAAQAGRIHRQQGRRQGRVVPGVGRTGRCRWGRR